MAKEAEVSGWHSFDAINAPSFTNHIENATDLYISQHCQIETYFLWFRCTQKRENVEEINFFCSVIEWKSQFYFKVMLLCMFLKCAERKWENFCFKVKKTLLKAKNCVVFPWEREKKWENSKFQQIDSTIFLLVYWWTIFRRLRPRTINKLHLIY